MVNGSDVNKNAGEGESTKDSFFSNKVVVKGCDPIIQTRFETLINARCEKPFDWYQQLGLDKGYASRVRRGLIIPPKYMKIKIAQYFKTDSMTIWEVEK